MLKQPKPPYNLIAGLICCLLLSSCFTSSSSPSAPPRSSRFSRRNDYQEYKESVTVPENMVIVYFYRPFNAWMGAFTMSVIFKKTALI